MAKEKNATVNPFFRELFQLGVYKRSQGKIARQATFATLSIMLLIGAWRIKEYAIGAGRPIQIGIPVALLVIGLWVAYRLVNMPNFADFLIGVEAEMNKVSWPSRTELIRSSLVVVISIIFLAVLLFAYDFFWGWLLQQVIHIAS